MTPTGRTGPAGWVGRPAVAPVRLVAPRPVRSPVGRVDGHAPTPPRRVRRPLAHVDPRGLPPLYATPVADALAARDRWRALLGGTADGAVRDRLEASGTRIAAGVSAVWSAVQRLLEIERVRDDDGRRAGGQKSISTPSREEIERSTSTHTWHFIGGSVLRTSK